MNNTNSDPISSSCRIIVRFGDEVLQAGFTSVPNLVLNHYAELGITCAEMMFIVHIWQYWWSEKDPYPSLQTIAARMNVSLRQVHNYVSGLKKKQFLVVNQRFITGRGQTTSEYDFAQLIGTVVKQSQQVIDNPVKDTSPGGMNNTSPGGVKYISGDGVKPIAYEEYEDKEYESLKNSKTRKLESSNFKIHEEQALTQQPELPSNSNSSKPRFKDTTPITQTRTNQKSPAEIV